MRAGRGQRVGRRGKGRVRVGMAGRLSRSRSHGSVARAGLLPLLVGSAIGAAAGLADAAPAAAQDYTHPKEMGLPEADFERPDPDPMRVEMFNGLTAYVAVDDRVPLLTLTAFVAAGSVHGAPGEAAVVGEALRNGPASMTAGAFHDAIDRMTADYTVSVGREETEITLDVPVEDAWAAMELLAATLADPAFGAEGGDAPERASSVEGIDYASSMAGAIALFEDGLFRGHVLGRDPSAEEMTAARSGGAEGFHRTRFVPASTVLAVAGDFDAVEPASA